MDKKAIVDFLRQAGLVPQGGFTGQVTFVVNFNQGGITSIERTVKDTILK